MSRKKAPVTFTIGQKLVILMNRAQERGQDISYKAISDASHRLPNAEPVSLENVLRIYQGTNQNPTYKTLLTLATVLGTDIGYFGCESEAECLEYLTISEKEQLTSEVARRADGISPKALNNILAMIDYVREAEGLSEKKPDKK